MVGIVALVEKEFMAYHPYVNIHGHSALSGGHSVLAEDFGGRGGLLSEAATLAGLKVKLEGVGRREEKSDEEKEGGQEGGRSGVATHLGRRKTRQTASEGVRDGAKRKGTGVNVIVREVAAEGKRVRERDDQVENIVRRGC